jgi:hypothetical protein
MTSATPPLGCMPLLLYVQYESATNNPPTSSYHLPDAPSQLRSELRALTPFQKNPSTSLVSWSVCQTPNPRRLSRHDWSGCEIRCAARATIREASPGCASAPSPLPGRGARYGTVQYINHNTWLRSTTWLSYMVYSAVRRERSDHQHWDRHQSMNGRVNG